MKLQDQVCTLEQAKKLNELGIEQESLFCFIGDDNPDPRYNTPYNLYYSEQARGEVGASWYEYRISTFTTAELGAVIGSLMKVKHLEVPDEITEKYAKYEDDYYALFNPKFLADVVILWIKNKLTTSEEVNQILNA